MAHQSSSDQRLAEWYDRALARSGVTCESRLVNTPRGVTHVLVAGAADAPPVVLVPGGGTNAAAIWLSTIRTLEPAHRVYALDLPGHPGRSAHEVIPVKGPGFAEWLEGVLDALGHREAAFVGASLGAFAILKLAAIAPSRISRAVLANPGGIVPISLLGLLRVTPALLVCGLLPTRERVRRAIRRILGPESLIDEELVEFFEIAMEPGRIPTDNMRPAAVPPERLTSFRSPTLVITGERDLFFPAGAIARQVPRTLPTARVHVIEGMNHMPGSKEVDKMNALLREFLGAAEARAASAQVAAGVA